jgi:hypothetical protein
MQNFICERTPTITYVLCSFKTSPWPELSSLPAGLVTSLLPSELGSKSWALGFKEWQSCRLSLPQPIESRFLSNCLGERRLMPELSRGPCTCRTFLIWEFVPSPILPRGGLVYVSRSSYSRRGLLACSRVISNAWRFLRNANASWVVFRFPQIMPFCTSGGK